MNLSKISGKLDNLPEKEKKAILALIDYKTESDMKEVIMEIRNMESKFDSKFNAIESKFASKFDAIESKFASKFDAIESKFSILLWVVGTVGFVITIMITIFKFIG